MTTAAMGFSIRVVAGVLALSGVAGAIKPHMARATPVNQYYHENGWTPKPTTKPKPLLELFKRQSEPEFCGYLEGDRSLPVSCDPGTSCMYDDVFSWFGCCTGTSITDCDVYTACVASTKVDDCLSDSSCANDLFVTACTEKSEPYCAFLYTTVSESYYGHFICDSTSTSYEVVSAATTGANPDTSFTPFGTESLGGDSTKTTRRTPLSQPTVTDVNTPSPRSRPTQTELSSSSEADSGTSSTRTTTPGPATPQGPVVAPPPRTSSSAGAVRTAQAVAGAVGGVAGIFALML